MGWFTKQKTEAADDGDDSGSGFLHPESALPSNRSLSTSNAWTKERSSQQLELADVHPRTRVGCCKNCMEYIIKFLHVIDLCLGIALIVYGSLLTQFTEPARAAILFCINLGTFHFLTSLVGILSFMGCCLKNIACSKYWGLALSAFVGPYFALIYASTCIALAFDTSGFLTYLDDHKEVMYLGPNVVDNVENAMPAIYTILSVLAVLELARFPVLKKLQARLIEKDEADALIPRSTASTSSVANATLTEALLDDNEASERGEVGGSSSSSIGGDGGGVSRQTAETPNWWDGN